MKFARLALFSTPRPIRTKLPIFMDIGKYHLQIDYVKIQDDKHVYIVFGVSNFDSNIELNEENKIKINNSVRSEIEDSIENLANILSVSEFIPVSISSPHPIIILKPDDESDRDILSKATGIESFSADGAFIDVPFLVDLDSIPKLGDRIEGFAIAAEAISSNRASGRFKDSIRLFERAFSLAGISLIDPLYRFLNTGFGGYEIDEVHDWIIARHGIIHADRSKNLIFERDVLPISKRVLQAMYDVLLNKKEWRSVSAERNQIWKPLAYTYARDMSLSLSKKSGHAIDISFIDMYRRFSLHLNGNLSVLPKGWWAGVDFEKSKREHLATGNLKIEE